MDLARAPAESMKDVSEIFRSVFPTFSLEVLHHDGNIYFKMGRFVLHDISSKSRFSPFQKRFHAMTLTSHRHDELDLCTLKKRNHFLCIDLPIQAEHFDLKTKFRNHVKTLREIIHFWKTLSEREDRQSELTIFCDYIQDNIEIKLRSWLL